MYKLTEIKRGPDSAAPRRFSGVADIFRFFNLNPAKLVDYIEVSKERRNSIPGVHAAQLADMVNIPLQAVGDTYKTMPVLVSIANFRNVDLIISTAKAKFWS